MRQAWRFAGLTGNLVAGSGPLIFFKTTGNPDGYNT